MNSQCWAVDAAVAGAVSPGLAPLLDSDYRPSFFFVRIADLAVLALLGANSVFRAALRESLGQHILVTSVIVFLALHGTFIVISSPFPGWDEWKLPVKLGSLVVVGMSVTLNHVHSIREEGADWISDEAVKGMSITLVVLAAVLFLVLFLGFWGVMLEGAKKEETVIQQKEIASGRFISRLRLCGSDAVETLFNRLACNCTVRWRAVSAQVRARRTDGTRSQSELVQMSNARRRPHSRRQRARRHPRLILTPPHRGSGGVGMTRASQSHLTALDSDTIVQFQREALGHVEDVNTVVRRRSQFHPSRLSVVAKPEVSEPKGREGGDDAEE